MLLALLSFSSIAYEKNAYSKAIAYGPFVADLDQLLTKASARYTWTYQANRQGVATAQLLHKGYDIKVSFPLKDNTITIMVDYVKSDDCFKACTDIDGNAQGWLLRLRKSITLEITKAARDDALVLRSK